MEIDKGLDQFIKVTETQELAGHWIISLPEDNGISGVVTITRAATDYDSQEKAYNYLKTLIPKEENDDR